MRIVSFDDYRIGVLNGSDDVVDVTGLVPELPDEFKPLRMLLLIERWDSLRPQVAAMAASESGVPLNSVHLLPPVPAPRKVYAQPVNYRAHQQEMQESPWSGTAPQVSSDQGMFLKASAPSPVRTTLSCSRTRTGSSTTSPSW